MKVPVHCFSVHSGSFEPIYSQLAGQIERMCLAGTIKPGDQLPSVRELALALVVNPMTITKALSVLEFKGIIKLRRGRGMFVQNSIETLEPSAREVLLLPTFEISAKVAADLQISLSRAISIFSKVLREQLSKQKEFAVVR